NASWMTRTSASSITGSGTASFSAAANSGGASRTGTVTVAGQTVTVAQAGTGCGLAVSPTNRKFDANGATGSVWIVGGSSCGWTASSTETWITISSSNSGSGNATVGYSVQSNTASSSRTGMLIIGGRILTVNQAANNQTFFPQFSAGAEWESELVLTNPSSSETATGSVTVLNDGGEQIEDS